MGEEMKRGMLITFEGGEGSGKSTQHKLFMQRLVESEIPVLNPPPREPGGTRYGEAIRTVLLSNEHVGLVDRAELMLFGASRAQLVDQLVLPALMSGLDVALDRFYDSTTAYQGYGRGLKLEDVQWMINYATGGLKPDLTFLFDIDPEIGIERATRDEADRLESEKIAFHHRVRQGFLAVARQDPDRVVIFDGLESIETLQFKVWQYYNFAKELKGR